MCIDEGRMRGKSKRNPFKIINSDRPIRLGWKICKNLSKKEFMVVILLEIISSKW